MITSADIETIAPHDHDADYAALLQSLQARFIGNVVATGGALFTTGSAGDLYPRFLDNLPPELRQLHTCRTCRRFVERFGGLVTIDEHGVAHSAMWHEDDARGVYAPAIGAMLHTIGRGPVAGVFYSGDLVWGIPFTDPWRHFAILPPAQLVFRSITKTPGQAIADKLHDYHTLVRALTDFTPEVLQQAVALLQSEALYRSEAVLGPATWLAELRHSLNMKNMRQRDNLIWRAVASAPTGFCHPRSTMIGTLLEDLAAGLPFDQVKKRFGAKMGPLKYQRPQAPPKEGNIAQAETIVAQLGAAGALARRYARLDEVQALWRPKPHQEREEREAAGVFGHLRASSRQQIPRANQIPPPLRMTWAKFRRDVLPTAESISFLVPGGPMQYTALLTAGDPAAPPIVQWDREDRRNPVSWYTYARGSQALQWGLTPGQYHPISAIALMPYMWADEDAYPHQGKRVLFLLEGAKDLNAANVGLGLFPSLLRAEFHPIRATIEAYSNRGTLTGAEEASACGLMLGSGREWAAVVRVVGNGTTIDYVIDRWE